MRQIYNEEELQIIEQLEKFKLTEIIENYIESQRKISQIRKFSLYLIIMIFFLLNLIIWWV